MSNCPPASPATLSLCLIVRDGGTALAEVLASARPYMDEMVVVDTGSTDDSRQVAANLGARVVEFPWCDDFSAARNHSLERASSDWIFWMDADDILPAPSGHELRRVIAEHPQRNAAFWVTVEEEVTDRHGRPRVMGHAHVKLFPRHPDIRFRYRVHEQNAPAIRQLGLPIRPTTAVVRHAHVDRSPAAEQARGQRNLRLALLDLAEHPGDPFVWLSLGTTYLFIPDGLPSAINYLRQSVAGLQHRSTTQLNAFLYLGQALGTSGDRQQEEHVYRQALELFPGDTMLLTRLGSRCANTGRLTEAAACYESILQRGNIRTSTVHHRGGQAPIVLRLGQIYLRMGQRDQADRLWRDFLQHHPDATEINHALAKLDGGTDFPAPP